MKKGLLILLCLPMLFSSCEEDNTTPNTNNNGNNSDTFLSINDGTVWVYQGVSSSMSTFLGGDSLIGFYNADNFVCHIYKEEWNEECLWWSEGFIGGYPTQVEIITNNSNELEVTIGFTIGSTVMPYMKRRITMLGSNQLIEEGFMIDSLGQEQVFSSDYPITYIKSTTLQNLSCN